MRENQPISTPFAKLGESRISLQLLGSDRYTVPQKSELARAPGQAPKFLEVGLPPREAMWISGTTNDGEMWKGRQIMLVIQRKPEENIIIGDNIRVSVLAIKGKRVIIGIDAPKEIPIHREENHHEQERLQPNIVA